MSGRATAELVELATNVEPRRPGEVALGILGSRINGFAWVPVQDARDFARRILVAARDAEDLLAPPAGERVAGVPPWQAGRHLTRSSS